MTKPDENTEAKQISRDEIINMLGETSKKLYLRITAGRFREHQSDATLLAFVRALAQITASLNSCMRDAELQELEQRLQALENQAPQREKEKEAYV